MLSLPPSVRIHVARGATDMRKSFDTLAALVIDVIDVIDEDPMSGHLFLFVNRRKNASVRWSHARGRLTGAFKRPRQLIAVASRRSAPQAHGVSFAISEQGVVATAINTSSMYASGFTPFCRHGSIGEKSRHMTWPPR